MPALVRLNGFDVELWFGGADTPVPPDPPALSTDSSFTVAVSGARPTDQVLVRYRSNGRPGQIRLARARKASGPDGHPVLLLSGEIIGLKPGSQVSYSIVFERLTHKGVQRLPTDADAGRYPYQFVLANGAGFRDAAGKPADGTRVESSSVVVQPTPPVPPSTPPLSSPRSAPATSTPSLSTSAAADPAEKPFVVRGHVTYKGGQLIPDVIVRAFNKSLRGEDILGEATTDREGHYDIAYSPKQFRDKTRPYADVIVRVFEKPGAAGDASLAIGAPLAESPVRFAAQPVEKIKLVVDGGPEHTWSEYEQMMSELSPLLGNTDITSLNEDETQKDITFLAGQTTLPARRIAFLVVAHKLAARTGVGPEVFYGLARQNLPTTLPELLAQSAEIQRQALESAIREGVIPGRLLQSLESILQGLRDLVVKQALEPPRDLGRTSLGALLGTVLADKAQQTQFLTAYVNHKGPIEAFWKGLGSQSEFKDRVTDLQVTLQIGALTGNHLPLVQELQNLRRAGEFKSVRDLARYESADWERIIGKAVQSTEVAFPPDVSGATDEEKTRNYATTIAGMVEDAFPTEVLASRIQRDQRLNRADMRTFFQNVLKTDTGFELGRTRIAPHLGKNPALLAGVTDQKALVSQLNAAQRVFRLTPRADAAIELLSKGVGSALAITRMGEATFKSKFGAQLGDGEVARLYQRADQTVATALNLFATYNPTLNGTALNVLPAPQSPSAIPDWETLFGTFALCECPDCHSVHSPAAYLVEMLAYLKERASKDAGLTVKDVLLQRRPDLGQIELTCQNTTTPMPYVDLVNEILENSVAPFQPFQLPVGIESDLTQAVYSETLRAAFSNRGMPIGSQGSVVTVQPGSKWFVTDHTDLYPLVKDQTTGELRVLSRNYQTSTTPEELNANPEHINSAAYDTLHKAVFPWKLPFDMWLAEVRAYLKHLGIERHELMESFQPGGPSSDPTDIAIDVESLNLSSRERQIITGTLSPNPKPSDFWGLDETNNPLSDLEDPRLTVNLGWLDVLKRVRQLMDRSSLSYDDLTNLLATNFVNPPALDIRIQAISQERDPNTNELAPVDPATCDTSKLIVTSLDASVADRIHRFVRLWCALGWSIEETDSAITALQADIPDVNQRLNDNLLQKLAHLQWLREEFEMPVDRVLTLWSNIGVTGENSLYRRLFQNPSVLKPIDAAFALAGAELDIVTSSPAEATITKHTSAILAALGISADELAAIRTDSNLNDDPGPPEVAAPLNLAALSALFRVTVLAKGLRLSVSDTLALKQLIGIDPFDPAQTKGTVRLVQAAKAIRASKFSIAELNYLLLNRYSETSGVAPSDDDIALILADIRTTLQRVRDDTTLVPDATADVLRKKLASLKWDDSLTDQAIATLNGTAIYETALDHLPNGFTFPDDAASKIYYDAITKNLVFAGPMTQAEQASLLGASPDGAYQTAVRTLADAPRRFVTERMRAFEVPTFAAPLAALPSGLRFPARLGKKIFYNSSAKELRFVGFMEDEDHTELLDLSGDGPYRAAIEVLFNAPKTFAPPPAAVFLTAADATVLFDTASPSESRINMVLARLLPTLRTMLGISAVKQKLGEALRLDGKTTELLLTESLNSPASPPRKCIEDFLAPNFAESNVAVEVSPSAFGDQFRCFRLLSKAALIITRFKLTSGQLVWLHTYGPAAGWLDLSGLPLEAGSPSAPFDSWERLADLCRLRLELPGGEAALSEILALSNDPITQLDTLLERLSSLTGWNLEDLRELSSTLRIWNGHEYLSLTQPTTYLSGSALLRLSECMACIKRLGASARQCIVWARTDVTEADAHSVVQTVKAKYDDTQWLQVAKPLRDLLRESQRAALVSYLVAHPTADQSGAPAWSTVNQLYEYFLIDVEMDPCMITSRIKQAISSVQLFVQRCLMNREPRVTANDAEDTHWREWKWMKSYRVWEANRRVFLTPENWIEPDLRDDRTSFFKDLQSELLQHDVTLDTAEDAFLHYLEKLDTVARLEIVGMYQQVETGSQGQTSVDILHVFARTRGAPHIYYYRQRVDASRWTPWEKVDLDIEGDHLIPVVWNRRLHLFWPVFVDKADETTQPPTQTATSQSATPPVRHWEIQLAWSEYKQKKWLPKRLTAAKLLSKAGPVANDRDSSRADHVFRAVPDATGGLSIYCEYTYSTVATGPRYYRNTTRIVRGGGRFYLSGCGGEVMVAASVTGPVIRLPRDVRTFEMMLQETVGSLYLPRNLATASYDVALTLTPGDTPFTILYAHQDFYLTGQRSFFFQDDSKTFFAIPEETTLSRVAWQVPDRVRPELIDLVRTKYYAKGAISEKTAAVVAAGGSTTPSAGPTVTPSRSDLRESGRILPFPGAKSISKSEPVTVGSLTLGDMSALSTANFSSKPILEPRGAKEAMIAGHAATFMASSTVGAIVSEKWLHPPPTIATSWKERRYRFETFYHPYVCDFISRLNHEGIDGLLKRSTQLQSSINFKDRYGPTDLIIRGDPAKEDLYPREDVDFTYEGTYSVYNWEVFFHAPLLIATRLSLNQRFEEAQVWYHRIFDPTSTCGESVPQKYWRTRPFFEATAADYQAQQIENLVRRLAANEPAPELEHQVTEWRQNPFNPHLIARLRNTAYQKTVVMKYLDNLIAWADQLFRRDTIESINEATQLYVMAADILGRRPTVIPPRAEPTVQTYESLDPRLEDFSDRLVQAEHFVPSSSSNAVSSPLEKPPLPSPTTVLYFCVPQNEKLLGYWDLVADRLLKVRHCMNIEGVVRELPLFEAKIEPGLLVRAVAAGIDISSALNDINAALPHYRFSVMLQKAAELCSDVKALGQALLAALEKRDAEDLALLRSSHEIALLNRVRQVKERQVAESKVTLEGLKNTKKVTEVRRDYYRDIAERNDQEREHLEKLETAQILQTTSQGIELLAGALALIPKFTAGASGAFGSPHVVVSFGGYNLATAVQVASKSLSLAAGIESHQATKASIEGGFKRRWDDWKLQEKLANKELDQIDKQIEASDVRRQIAEQELANHDTQVDNAMEADAFMRGKFTSRDLYDWMVGQISSLYFQGYQLAYDTAKRAERAYRFELGLDDSNFIQFGYWDSLKKGLLAGDRLHQDLKRLDLAYLDQHRREYEITKHVSVAMLDPIALVKLKETGECFLSIPESVFDLDYPGHFMRRVKSVGMTIPCVVGPYTGVNCTLTLVRSSIRRVSTLGAGKYARATDIDDPRFLDNLGAIQSIATSHAQNDSGMFELNFRDERYLPFEGAGAISTWRVQLAKGFRQFDYSTISDVIIGLRYTARGGGDALRDQVTDELETSLNEMALADNRRGIFRLFSLRHEFPTEWYRFLNTADPSTGDHTQQFPLSKERFPFWQQARNIKIREVGVIALSKNGSLPPVDIFVTPPGATPTEASDVVSLESDATLSGALYNARSYPMGQEKSAGPSWTVKVKGEDFAQLAESLDDVGLLFGYSLEQPQ